MSETSKKIKVAHLIHTLGTGGAQKVIVNLLHGIDNSKFDMHTLCMQEKGPIYDEIKGLGAKVSQIPKKYRLDLNIVPKLRKFLVDGKYDILHTHNFSAGLWGRMAVLGIKKNRPKMVHTEHGRRGNIELWRKMIMRYYADKTDVIISVSDETQDYLINKVGIDSKNLVVIKNGIDLDHLNANKDAPVKEIDAIREKNPDARFITNVSALTPVKDHATLIRAFGYLHEKCPDVYLLLVGDGPLRLELQKLALSLEVDSHVIFMGVRQDVAAILGKCEIFVLSSRNEGHPISLLEAMSMGIVPVATHVGGIPELIENTVNGLTVTAQEPQLLAKSLRIPLEEKALAREWGEKSREIVLAEYTAKVMAANHSKLYEQLVG